MNLKISTIINSTIGIILFIFSIFCFALNYYTTIPLGIISLFSSIIISPLFELLCKKINKKFTILQKLTLIYGTIMITYICTLINDLDNSYQIFVTITKPIYILITFLVILIYWILFIVFNKHKYNQTIKVSLKKRIILIIISILLINLPLNIIKIYFLNNYYKQIEYISPYKILEDIDVNSYKNVNNITNFDKLLYRNDFRDFELTTQGNGENQQIIYKNEKMAIRFSRDLLNTIYYEIDKDDILYYQLYRTNNIKSTGTMYEFFNQNKNITIFDNIYKINFILHNYVVFTSNIIDSYQKIKSDNNLNIYLLTKQISKEHINYEIIVDNDEYAYSIYFYKIQGEMTKDYIMDFIKTLDIE